MWICGMYVRLSLKITYSFCVFMVVKCVSASATGWLTDMVLKGFEPQWISVTQRKKRLAD